MTTTTLSTYTTVGQTIASGNTLDILAKGAVHIDAAAAAVANASKATGVSLNNAGTITNAFQTAGFGVDFQYGGTIVNSGKIIGATGVSVAYGASVTNTAGATISSPVTSYGVGVNLGYSGAGGNNYLDTLLSGVTRTNCTELSDL